MYNYSTKMAKLDYNTNPDINTVKANRNARNPGQDFRNSKKSFALYANN